MGKWWVFECRKGKGTEAVRVIRSREIFIYFLCEVPKRKKIYVTIQRTNNVIYWYFAHKWSGKTWIDWNEGWMNEFTVVDFFFFQFFEHYKWKYIYILSNLKYIFLFFQKWIPIELRPYFSCVELRKLFHAIACYDWRKNRWTHLPFAMQMRVIFSYLLQYCSYTFLLISTVFGRKKKFIEYRKKNIMHWKII